MSTAAVVPFRILIVEDDLDMQFLIQSVLTTDPRLEPVAKTSNAMEAVALTLEVGPALVILDHGLEGEIMGLRAAPMIKALAPDVRIILFTSQDLSLEVHREPAIDVYLPKTDLNKLLHTVQRLLGLEPLAST